MDREQGQRTWLVGTPIVPLWLLACAAILVSIGLVAIVGKQLYRTAIGAIAADTSLCDLPPDIADLEMTSMAERESEQRLRQGLAEAQAEVLRRRVACRVPRSNHDPDPLRRSQPNAREQTVPSPAQQEDLPLDRWTRRDLSLLEGCWILTNEARSTLDPFGPNPVPGTIRAGRICFDRDGRGIRENVVDFDNGVRITCRAAVVGEFSADGMLRTRQEHVVCEPPTVHWVPEWNNLTCSRHDDRVANCRDGLGRAHEFRRDR